MRRSPNGGFRSRPRWSASASRFRISSERIKPSQEDAWYAAGHLRPLGVRQDHLGAAARLGSAAGRVFDFLYDAGDSPFGEGRRGLPLRFGKSLSKENRKKRVSGVGGSSREALRDGSPRNGSGARSGRRPGFGHRRAGGRAGQTGEAGGPGGGVDLVLDIDVQGAEQVKRAMPEAVLIFILPPSFQVLDQRLRGRRQNPPDDIERRLAVARREVSQYRNYDYAVVNDDIDRCAGLLRSIVFAERAKRERMEPIVKGILDSFQ